MTAANPKDEGGGGIAAEEMQEDQVLGACRRKRRRVLGVKDGLRVGVQSITVGCTSDMRGTSPMPGLGCT